MLKIGQICLKNNIIAGPMAGISNPAFRSICVEHGVGLVVSEMISDKAICYRNKKTLNMLKTYENEHPVALQLFGNDPITMGKAAKYLATHSNADIIDINMGCPVNKVIKAGAGSNLMLDEQLASDIVKAVKNASKLPVTVKIRLGFDDNNLNYINFAKALEKAGADAITLHPRTRSQMYLGKANWQCIKLLKESLNIPVIGNGDIKNADDAIKMLNETNCDGVMISRASIGNPWIFDNILNKLDGKKEIIPTLDDIKNTCLEHTIRLIKYENNEHIAISQMRGIASHYFKGFNGANKIRNDLSNINSLEDLKDVLNSIEK